MAGFTFRLEKVLQHRVRLEDQAKQEMLQAQLKLIQAENQLRVLINQKENLLRQFSTLLSSPKISPIWLLSYQQSLSFFELKISRQQNLLAQNNSFLELKKKEYFAARRKRRTLEILKERDLHKLLGKVQKAERDFLDDIVAAAAVRK